MQKVAEQLRAGGRGVREGWWIGAAERWNGLLDLGQDGWRVGVLGALGSLEITWRVGGLSNCLFWGLISTITPIRVPFRVLISLLTTYLLSPPTLQVQTIDQ